VLLHFGYAAKASAYLFTACNSWLSASFPSSLVYPLHFITPGKAALAFPLHLIYGAKEQMF
jgi:hypothetical protein